MYYYDPEWLVLGGPPFDGFCKEDTAVLDETEALRLELVAFDVWRVVHPNTNMVLAEGEASEMLEYLTEWTTLSNQCEAEANK
jgi:hypothetical protein